jgi:hypothetical protein
MNIDNTINLINVNNHHQHFVHNIAQKQWIVNEIMVRSNQIQIFPSYYLEQSACINPSWSSRTIKYTQKIQRTCYIRITEVLRYEQAERMCRKYGLQLAIIDNISLLERLKQLNMCRIKELFLKK